MGRVFYGSIIPDITVQPDRTDIDYKLYKYDIHRSQSKEYADASIANIGNRVFYSIAHDVHNRPLKLQKNWDSNILYNTFVIHGGMFVCDDTIECDSRIYVVYTDPNNGEIVDVKSNQLHVEKGQATFGSYNIFDTDGYYKQVIFNSSALVNISSDDTAGIFVSVGGLELSNLDETVVYESPISDVTFMDGTNDIYHFYPTSSSFDKLDITSTKAQVFGHSYAYVKNKLYSFGGGVDISVLDFSNLIFNIKDNTDIGIDGVQSDTQNYILESGSAYQRFDTPQITGYEKYLCGKTSGFQFGEYDVTNAVSTAGRDGWFRQVGDNSCRIKRMYFEVSWIKYARIVIIGLESGIVYENQRQIFPCVIDIDGLVGKEVLHVYIALPENTNVRKAWGQMTEV